MVDFEELRALVAVAQYGSILEAATTLRTSRARIRRKLAALEERTGVPLLVRVQGKLTPTEAGEALVVGGQRLLNEGALLMAHARESVEEPGGTLRMAVQVGAPPELVMMSGRLMRARASKMQVEVRIAEDPLALVPEQADFAIRVGERVEVPSCAQFLMARLEQRLLASPSYLDQYGEPRTVDELRDHAVAMWRSPDGRDDHLTLSDGRRLPIRPQLVCADQQLLMQLAQIVGALVYVPLAPPPARKLGGLIPVLEGQVGRTIELRCYVPHVLRAVPRIRALVEIVQAVALAD